MIYYLLKYVSFYLLKIIARCGAKQNMAISESAQLCRIRAWVNKHKGKNEPQPRARQKLESSHSPLEFFSEKAFKRG